MNIMNGLNININKLNRKKKKKDNTIKNSLRFSKSEDAYFGWAEAIE